MREKGCEVGGPPDGIMRTVAQRAYRDFGSARSVRMVVVSVPGMRGERSSLFQTVSCDVGASVMQFNARELQAPSSKDNGKAKAPPCAAPAPARPQSCRGAPRDISAGAA